MAYFFTHLLLDVSESNVISQGEILLRYVLPESYGSFKTKLLIDEKRLKKQQLSLCFAPKTIAFNDPLTADITGILSTYVGSQKISSNQETYRIGFAKQKGRLFLKSFETIKPREESNDEAQ